MADRNVLIIGGSGFVSGTLARLALQEGDAVWTVTRGQRDQTSGVTPLVVDRHDRAAFADVIGGVGMEWDLVVDCIAFEPDDIRQDIEVLRHRAGHLLFVSTDFVYAPSARRFPQPEEGIYQRDGYGGQKRACEEVLAAADCGTMCWTIVRPCHIYGPGSLLGCLPRHGRDPQLIDRLRQGEALALVGGGHFLQQPILAADLARLLLSVHGNAGAHGQTYLAAGPDVVESRTYYQIIADILDVPLHVAEVPVTDELAAHPETVDFLCHRFYDLSKLHAAGLHVPSTSLRDGLEAHVDSLLERGD